VGRIILADFGYNYTHFFDPYTYGSAGFNYSDREDPSDNLDSVSLNINRLYGVEENSRSYYRLSASYSVQTNFREGEMYTLGAAFYHKLTEQRKYDFEYRYIYSLDRGDHLYNTYTLGYSFPMGIGKKLKLGYQYVDYVAAGSGWADDHDGIFQTVLYVMN